MATTKSAQYQFRVKEGPCDPHVVLEPAGGEPAAGRPLKDLDLTSFTLRPGISLDEAQQSPASIAKQYGLRNRSMLDRDAHAVGTSRGESVIQRNL